MAQAVIVEAVRSPIGKRNGALAGMHPADLSAQVLNALIMRAGIEPVSSRPPSTTWSGAASAKWASRPTISRVRQCWPLDGPTPFQE